MLHNLVMLTKITSSVTHPYVLFDMRSTLRQRDYVVKMKVTTLHSFSTQMADIAITFQYFVVVNRTNSGL